MKRRRMGVNENGREAKIKFCLKDISKRNFPMFSIQERTIFSGFFDIFPTFSGRKWILFSKPHFSSLQAFKVPGFFLWFLVYMSKFLETTFFFCTVTELHFISFSFEFCLLFSLVLPKTKYLVLHGLLEYV